MNYIQNILYLDFLPAMVFYNKKRKKKKKKKEGIIWGDDLTQEIHKFIDDEVFNSIAIIIISIIIGETP